jgi:hypothetical protein
LSPLAGHRLAISPHAFFAGLFVGLVFLSYAGRVVSNIPYMQFNRLHRYINPQSVFYPTASELTAVAEAAALEGKIVVIIGGSSAFFGAGQGSAELWSDSLQQLIGDRFKVLNFAMPGGAPTEFGGVATQALLKKGYPAIYVADMSPAVLGRPSGLGFGYIYWDALFKGLLPDFGLRDVWVETAPRSAVQNAAVEEERIRGRIESWSYATDFWNWVGYTYAFTTPSFFTQLPFAWPTTPRRVFSDPELHAIVQPLDRRYSSESLDRETAIVGGMANLVCDEQADGTWAPSADKTRRDDVAPDIEAAFPPGYRRSVVMVMVPESAYYLDRLPPDQQRCYHLAGETTAQLLRAAGYTAVLGAPVGFDAEDYGDRTHLLPRGAMKVAQLVAPTVTALAGELGYLQ